MKNFIYSFMYNGCVYESSWTTISLHRTKKGAEKALKEHRQKELDEFNKLDLGDDKYKFGEHEDWCIKKVQIFD